MRSMWIVILPIDSEDAEKMLQTLKMAWPQYKFKIGRRYYFYEQEVAHILGLMPWPHPNDETRALVEWIDRYNRRRYNP
jgi:hypothetical protein